MNPSLAAMMGASGVAVLLELARVLNETDLKTGNLVTFFDAEDRGHIDGCRMLLVPPTWLRICRSGPQCMVLVDMIGDADQIIFWEANSDPELLQEIWDVCGSVGGIASISCLNTAGA